jgi:methionine salvage enolase-phosphatase E1
MSNILFVTDNINGKDILNLWHDYILTCFIEIFAATEAGYQVVISDRPGNAPLGPESKNFKIVTSFAQI